MKRFLFRSTSKNVRSSRSHAMSTILIEKNIIGKPSSENENEQRKQKMHLCSAKLILVDLAGSERLDSYYLKTSAKTKKETQHINVSLSCLSDVICALAQVFANIANPVSRNQNVMQQNCVRFCTFFLPS